MILNTITNINKGGMFDKGNKYDTGRKELDVKYCRLNSYNNHYITIDFLYKSIYQCVEELAS